MDSDQPILAPQPCPRCGQRYALEDRRAQLSGRAICRACHLDPGLRLLAISIPNPNEAPGRSPSWSSWISRTASSLFKILTRPGACFRALQEPVDLMPWVAFLLTVAAPSWMALVVRRCWLGWQSAGPRLSFTDPRWLDLSMGSAGVDALDLWSLAMMPLGMLALYFCSGTLAHLLVLLTGPSSRTLGASLRATAISWVPLLLITAPLELMLRMGFVHLELWLLGAAAAGLWSLSLLALGLARSHHTSLLRGWVAAPLPWLSVQLCFLLRIAFALKSAPFGMQ